MSFLFTSKGFPPQVIKASCYLQSLCQGDKKGGCGGSAMPWAEAMLRLSSLTAGGLQPQGSVWCPPVEGDGNTWTTGQQRSPESFVSTGVPWEARSPSVLIRKLKKPWGGQSLASPPSPGGSADPKELSRPLGQRAQRQKPLPAEPPRPSHGEPSGLPMWQTGQPPRFN